MAMMMGSKGGRGRGYRKNSFTEINVTPLVDVMLVLLVIFMITAPMMTAGVTVDLPESAAAPVEGQDEPLTITIKKDGRVFIQETEVKLGELQDKLGAIAGENKQTRIFVRGDKGIDYGTVMETVGEVNAAGFLKIALITEGLEGARRRR